MKNIVFLITLIILTSSCNNIIKVIKIKDFYGSPMATTKDLTPFNSKYLEYFTLNEKSLIAELNKIKGMKSRENIFEIGLNYAFILEKDTLYASPKLDYWLINDRVVYYSSDIIKTELFD